MSIEDQLERAIIREREWTQFLSGSGFDSGSYCESAGNDYTAAAEIRGLYRTLVDKLMAYERSGYKRPRS